MISKFNINDQVEVVSHSYEGLYGKVGRVIDTKVNSKAGSVEQDIRVDFNGYETWIAAEDCVSY